MFRTTHPISTDGSPETHHLDTFNMQYVSVNYKSFCDKRTSYVPLFQLPLTVRTGRVTINILPDDVLLLVFHFYREICFDGGVGVVDRMHGLPWRWHPLVHVCQRWRSVVFASPKFLDLALVCGPSTPLELIGIWPPLPIIIRDRFGRRMPKNYDFDAAIVHPSRVWHIDLKLSRWQWQRLASIMQEQFPALIHLRLDSANYFDDSALVLPDGFLGGSAPCLQSLKLDFIAFPALPNFLLSATALVRLTLWDIPHSGYLAPKAIVTGLALLANLKSLTIGFKHRSRPDQESRCPTCTVLPALTLFKFQGSSEYLDDFVARIDAPLLDSIFITFLNEFIFDISQLAQFMRRTTRVQALNFNEAHVNFDYNIVTVESLPPTWILNEKSGLSITCRAIVWQLSDLVEFFTSLFPSIYTVEHLYMYGPRSFISFQEPMQWLKIFYPFTAVKNFYVIKEFAHHIAPALQKLVGERATDVLPALERLFLEGLPPSGPVQEAIGQFVSERQLLGHPVAVSHWNNENLLTSMNALLV